MTKKITDLVEVTQTDDGDLLLIRDATDGVDKKMQAQNLRAKATTKADVGLGNVPDLDTTDAVNKAHDQNTDTALDQGGVNEVTAADARAHIDATDNPHGVTKAQVGLSDVDNVSAADLRDRSTHTGTQTLSTISDAGTIASQDANSVDIDGGNIDGTPIGANSADEGNFTTLDASGDVNFDSGTLFVDASANAVGIGTTSPTYAITTNVGKTTTEYSNSFAIKHSEADIFRIISGPITSLAGGAAPNNTVRLTTLNDFATYYDVGPDVHAWDTATNGECMRIAASGNVGIGTTNPDAKFSVVGESNGLIAKLGGNASVFSRALQITEYSVAGFNNVGFDFNAPGAGGLAAITFSTLSSEAMRIDSSGNVGIGTGSPSATLDVNGSLSKNSGSFKIDHPLKPDTHHLVHSFVEGPQADLIYRGKIDLVNGEATVNIDQAGRMTEGTFEALNCNVQCFTTNEDGWTCVRGSVAGNILTIEAEDNTCTDTISWMVVGERCDQHMIDTEWTDENGRVITEPKKEQQDGT